MEEMLELFRKLDWSPLIISLKTGAVATVFSFFLGIYAAKKVLHAGPRIKAIADGFLTLTLVLPPTVVGFFLLLLFSLRRPFDRYWRAHILLYIHRQQASLPFRVYCRSLPPMPPASKTASPAKSCQLPYRPPSAEPDYSLLQAPAHRFPGDPSDLYVRNSIAQKSPAAAYQWAEVPLSGMHPE
jgi:hypothetical protein